MNTIDEIRAWQAQERARARAKLLAEGVPVESVKLLLNEAHAMHEDQAECAARMVGTSAPVTVH